MFTKLSAKKILVFLVIFMILKTAQADIYTTPFERLKEITYISYPEYFNLPSLTLLSEEQEAELLLHIQVLSRDTALRNECIKSFLETPSKNTAKLFIYAIISMITDYQKGEFYNLITECFMHPIIVPLGENQILVGIVNSRGAYSENHTFFKLVQKTNSYKITPYALKDHKSKNWGNTPGPGNFSIEKREDTFVLEYADRHSSVEAGTEVEFILH